MRLQQWIYKLPLQLRSLFRRNAVEQELTEELQYHLGQKTREYVAAGLPPEEARRKALREFGGIELSKENCRDARPMSWVRDFVQDLRYGLRMLRKSPGFTTVAVLTLALGIGANTAIFSLMNALILRLLPVQHPEELMTLQMERAGRPLDDTLTNALWEAVGDQQDVFSAVLAWSGPEQFDLAEGGAVHYVKGLFVSGGYFATLGVRPAAGRLLAPSDDYRGCPALAVLSYAFWQSQLAGAEAAVGSTVLLRGHPFQVIGVAPPGFYGVEVGKDFDLAVPVCAAAPFDKRNLDSRGRWWLKVMGRAKPGVTLDQVEARLAVLSPSVMTAGLPPGDADWQKSFLTTTLIATPAANGASDLRSTLETPLTILMAMVALVLLIACANITSLMLARATTRGKEIAIRKALGASRKRLMRQLLTESLLLSALGAAVGVIFARWGSELLVRNLSTGRDPVFLDLSLDGRVLGFTAGVAVLTGALVSLLPALRSTRGALIEAMKPRSSAPGAQRALFQPGKWIVAGQLALSLVLLIGGELLLRTFINLLRVDLGFDRNNVLIVSAKAPWWAADDAKIPLEQRAIVDDQIAERLRSVPGVIAVSRSFIEPLGDDNWGDHIQPDNETAVAPEQIWFNFVSPQYLSTMRTSLIAGRGFNRDDTRESQPVAIVNETLARKLFSGSAVGRHFRQYEQDKPGPWVQIVGIMKDSKYSSVREAPRSIVLLPVTQAPADADTEDFELRTAVPPGSLISFVQRAIGEVNPQIPLAFRTLSAQVDDDLAQERSLATISGFFGGLALLLAVIGLYGVLSYLVTQRQFEFGIRIALGAHPDSILRLVMRDVALVLMPGILVGIGVSLVSVKILQKLLFGLAARDPVTMLVAVGLMSAMALLAGYLPARRATRVDPMVALRCE